MGLAKQDAWSETDSNNHLHQRMVHEVHEVHCALERWIYMTQQDVPPSNCYCHLLVLQWLIYFEECIPSPGCHVILLKMQVTTMPSPSSLLGESEWPCHVRCVCTGCHWSMSQDEAPQLCVRAQQQLHGYLKQEVQINLSSWNYRGNLGRQNAISQDTEVNTVNLVESAMGPLITATGQGLSFMSHPKDGTSRCLVVLLWLEEGNSATYCNSITSHNTWTHLKSVASILDCLKN